MFVLKSTHDSVVAELRAASQLVIQRQSREIDRLGAELAARQVPVVRGARGRFTKQEE